MMKRLSILAATGMCIMLISEAHAGFLEDLAKGIGQSVEQALGTPLGEQAKSTDGQQIQSGLPEDLDKLKRRVDALKRTMPDAPKYLYSVDTQSDTIATVWMDWTDKLVSDGARRARYDEFYYTSLDYLNLAQIALGRADKAIINNNAWRTGQQLQLVDRYLRLHNLTSNAATALYLGNNDEAYGYAKAIYDMSQSLVKLGSSLGKPIIGPYASYTFDLLFLSTDYMIDEANAGIDEANRKAAMKALVKIAFDAVPLKTLNGKTLNEFMTDKTGSYIGKGIASSRRHPIIDELLVSPEFLQAFRSTLAKTGAHLTQEGAKKLTVNALDQMFKGVSAGTKLSSDAVVAGTTKNSTPNMISPSSLTNSWSVSFPACLISGITFDEKGSLWIWSADYYDEEPTRGRCSKISNKQGKISALKVSDGTLRQTMRATESWSGGVAFGGGYLWAAGGGGIWKIDPESGARISKIPVKLKGHPRLAFDGTYIWLAQDSELIVLEPNTGNVVRTLISPVWNSAIAFDGKHLWMMRADTGRKEIHRVDSRTMEILETSLVENIPDSSAVTGLAWDGASLWVALSKNSGPISPNENTVVNVSAYIDNAGGALRRPPKRVVEGQQVQPVVGLHSLPGKGIVDVAFSPGQESTVRGRILHVVLSGSEPNHLGEIFLETSEGKAIRILRVPYAMGRSFFFRGREIDVRIKGTGTRRIDRVNTYTKYEGGAYPGHFPPTTPYRYEDVEFIALGAGTHDEAHRFATRISGHRFEQRGNNVRVYSTPTVNLRDENTVKSILLEAISGAGYHSVYGPTYQLISVNVFQNDALAVEFKGSLDNSKSPVKYFEASKSTYRNLLKEQDETNRKTRMLFEQRAVAKKQFGLFVTPFRVSEFVSISKLEANPFIFEGKNILLHGHFREMLNQTNGLVGSENRNFILTDIPHGRFTDSGPILLIAKVVGKKQGMTLLKYQDARTCIDNSCSELLLWRD